MVDEDDELTETDIGGLAESIDILVVGFRALEFMGTHSHQVGKPGGCKKCGRATVKLFSEGLSRDEALKLCCEEVQHATEEIAEAREIVEHWERLMVEGAPDGEV